MDLKRWLYLYNPIRTLNSGKLVVTGLLRKLDLNLRHIFYSAESPPKISGDLLIEEPMDAGSMEDHGEHAARAHTLGRLPNPRIHLGGSQ